MKVTTLLENKKVSDEFENHHGLSYYIETKKHRILFDMGQNGAFYNNALKLGIDLSEVDIAIVSHGHYDHGKGLRKFLEINNKAKVYVSQYGFEPHFSSDDVPGYYTYIGLPSELKDNKRIVFATDTFEIDDELILYSGIESLEYVSAVNKSLCVVKYKKSEHFCCNSESEIEQYGEKYSEEELKAYGDIEIDGFEHEQSLVINEENGETILIAGCCHAGIVNIVEQTEARSGLNMDKVFGGLHLFLPTAENKVSKEFLKLLAKRLMEFKADFYTGHCTGEAEYKKLKKRMKDRINYTATGHSIEF